MTIMDDPQLDLETGDDGGYHALLLEQMRRSVAAMAGDAATPLRRVRLSLGAATVEVEWESRIPAEPVHLPVMTAPAAIAAAPAAVAPAVAAPPPGEAPGEHVVTSPLVGTFYTTPEPGAPPFVKVGDTVVAGQQIGIVEAMKLMNPVEADRSGTVLRLLAGSGDAVEYEQALIVIAATDEE
ncbi:acetyl-CoA carboxylase biotin carboxyl carrier protein [Couchioplanes caeruleus]|uniref:Biotin carboxyl carrier protein of acetyl-CoA carboxylase n=2 Tax=Couchioplanes caeruleus TaxID=56438 RepID=A0A1K0FTP0_9ACTN|nr:acetyl-CoA carboxylase biotin carboxyl carrier protein [Couchioplanes caeruleus]OJF09554.1 acetyl-CoA carboxylase, biotin carboxyl carrier protein [Couchioplanes caeruleus subsp. caeruleus]OJF16173.1 acyl-CoA carboxylase, biotin carboxyl carrier protein [Couchioplanes caeruleus subsp. caeruleus]ROP34068.1 acetyl-CoA carboxylase biotin carboxyl carrier protein [Couchioplanes caeruleus]